MPAGLHADLRPYQQRGLDWLATMSRLGLGAVLADDMGLGKTLQVLALLAHEKGAPPTLLVAPMSVVGNWQREAQRFTPDLRVHVHHGAGRLGGDAFVEQVSQQRPGRHHLFARRPRRRPAARADLGPDRARRGPAHQERRDRPVPRRPVDPRAAPPRAHRNPGGEPARGTALHPRLRQPANAGQRAGVSRAVRDPDRTRARRDRRRPAAHRTAPFVLRRVKTDPDRHRRPAREVRDDRARQPHRRAGQPVPGRRRRDDAPDHRGRGHEPQGRGARRADPAQAGLQPSGALPARRFGGAAPRPAPFRQARTWSTTSSTPCSPTARRRCCSRSSASSATSSRRTSPSGSG